MTESRGRLSTLTKVETVLSAATGILAIVTIFWQDWIETITGWDPDHHNGTAEIYIFVGLAVISCGLILLTRVSWKRDRANGLATA